MNEYSPSQGPEGPEQEPGKFHIRTQGQSDPHHIRIQGITYTNLATVSGRRSLSKEVDNGEIWKLALALARALTL